jgi:hypothetical protein
MVEACRAELGLIQRDPPEALLVDGGVHVDHKPGEKATTTMEGVELASPKHQTISRPTHECELPRVIAVTLFPTTFVSADSHSPIHLLQVHALVPAVSAVWSEQWILQRKIGGVKLAYAG